MSSPSWANTCMGSPTSTSLQGLENNIPDSPSLLGATIFTHSTLNLIGKRRKRVLNPAATQKRRKDGCFNVSWISSNVCNWLGKGDFYEVKYWNYLPALNAKCIAYTFLNIASPLAATPLASEGLLTAMHLLLNSRGRLHYVFQENNYPHMSIWRPRCVWLWQ